MLSCRCCVCAASCWRARSASRLILGMGVLVIGSRGVHCAQLLQLALKRAYPSAQLVVAQGQFVMAGVGYQPQGRTEAVALLLPALAQRHGGVADFTQSQAVIFAGDSLLVHRLVAF